METGPSAAAPVRCHGCGVLGKHTPLGLGRQYLPLVDPWPSAGKVVLPLSCRCLPFWFTWWLVATAKGFSVRIGIDSAQPRLTKHLLCAGTVRLDGTPVSGFEGGKKIAAPFSHFWLPGKIFSFIQMLVPVGGLNTRMESSYSSKSSLLLPF